MLDKIYSFFHPTNSVIEANFELIEANRQLSEELDRAHVQLAESRSYTSQSEKDKYIETLEQDNLDLVGKLAHANNVNQDFYYQLNLHRSKVEELNTKNQELRNELAVAHDIQKVAESIIFDLENRVTYFKRWRSWRSP